jgi:hypothetical protein
LFRQNCRWLRIRLESWPSRRSRCVNDQGKQQTHDRKQAFFSWCFLLVPDKNGADTIVWTIAPRHKIRFHVNTHVKSVQEKKISVLSVWDLSWKIHQGSSKIISPGRNHAQFLLPGNLLNIGVGTSLILQSQQFLIPLPGNRQLLNQLGMPGSNAGHLIFLPEIDATAKPQRRQKGGPARCGQAEIVPLPGQDTGAAADGSDFWP